MAWTYSNYRSIVDPAARLAQLRLHMTEVSDKVGTSKGADGFNESSETLQEMLKQLREEELELMKMPGANGPGSGGMSNIRIQRPLPFGTGSASSFP